MKLQNVVANCTVAGRSNEFFQAVVIAALRASECGHATILSASNFHSECRGSARQTVGNSERKGQDVVTNSRTDNINWEISLPFTNHFATGSGTDCLIDRLIHQVGD